MKRFLVIAATAAIVIWVGAGCRNLKEVDMSITGFEAEWYEPPPQPVIVQPTTAPTNAPAGSWLGAPRLMQRKNRE